MLCFLGNQPGAALALQVTFAALVLRWGPGRAALRCASGRVETLIGYAGKGTGFSSIAIQIGTLGSLVPERRALVARLGLRALLAGSLANLANAAIAGVIARH